MPSCSDGDPMTKPKRRTLFVPASLCLALLLAGCGTATRYVVEAEPAGVPPAAKQRLRVASIELREVVLPAYGEDSKLLIEGKDGGLTPVRGSEWADSSARAITAELARSLDLRGSASVAAEPWPLLDGPDIRLEVRIERLIARANGAFVLAGQYAVSSPDGRMRDFLERFEISVPLADQKPATVARAYGAALDGLSNQILRRLARR